MLCSDDLHPTDLVRGHINSLLRRGVAAGLGLTNLLRCATVNPVRHYGLEVGLLQLGDPADDATFDARIAGNVARMDALAAEILARAREAHADIGDHGLDRLLAGLPAPVPSLQAVWYAAA